MIQKSKKNRSFKKYICVENIHLNRLKDIFQSFDRKIILSTLTFEHPEKTLLTLKLKKDEEVILRLSIPSILISDRFINVSTGFRDIYV